MDWGIILIVLLLGLLLAMFSGIPIAFTFILVSGIVMFFGPSFGMTASGVPALKQMILGMRNQLSNFSFTPIPFFVIMGEVFFQSGIITTTMDALSKMVRKVPGRLSVVTLLGGGIFAALSGSSLGNTAMFGSLMMPEMTRRGYSKELTTGSIIASGALAMIIPPSNQAVMLGGISGISVAKILLGAIGPGILMLILYIVYVILTCIRHPEYAPVESLDDMDEVTLSEKFKSFCKDILPLTFIFVVVIGVIFTGIGTATEAAALGALASYILAMAYRKFSLRLLMNTLIGSLRTSTMLLIIIAGSAGFSQVLSLTGASRSAVIAVTSAVSSPTLVLSLMLFIAFILGLFVEQAAIMMICLPLYMPILTAYDLDPIWFAILFLILLQVGQFTPPVGMSLFVMKSVSPPDVSMNHIIRGAMPFLLIDILVVVIIIVLPPIVTLIPASML
jgi:tripartite ATP-independent transporter DctM subunit